MDIKKFFRLKGFLHLQKKMPHPVTGCGIFSRAPLTRGAGPAYLKVARYAIRAARSLSFFRPEKDILVPLIMSFGLVRK